MRNFFRTGITYAMAASVRHAELDGSAAICVVQLSTSVRNILPLMPQFQPQMGQTSPATSQTDYTNLNQWAWTTRIDFQVKKLPVTGLSSGGAGDTPQGPASAPACRMSMKWLAPAPTIRRPWSCC